jgi:hypothetical protein
MQQKKKSQKTPILWKINLNITQKLDFFKFI